MRIVRGRDFRSSASGLAVGASLHLVRQRHDGVARQFYPLAQGFLKHRGKRLQFIFRLMIGGLAVSLFAMLGDILKPKSFAGLFGAAPSVALATLGLTISANGKLYAAREARSMRAGALGQFLYSAVTIWLIMKFGLRAKTASISAISVWLIFVFGAWLLVLR